MLTLVQPQVMPQVIYHRYVCMRMYVCRAFDRQVPMRVMGFNGDEHLLQTLSP